MYLFWTAWCLVFTIFDAICWIMQCQPVCLFAFFCGICFMGTIASLSLYSYEKVYKNKN